MDYSQIFAISASGMQMERLRVEVAALNLANANTVAAPNGHIYQPLKVVAQPVFGDIVSQELATVSVVPTQQAPRTVYEPGHPMANAEGFIAYAGVDPATEMMTLMGAMRSYEANVAAMNASRTMAMKTLEIGAGT